MAFWTMPLPGLMRKAGGAAIAFIAATTATSSASATLTFDKPAGVVSGDLMVAAIAYNSGGTLPSLSGWTQRYNLADGNNSIIVFSKVAGGAEPANYTANFAAASYQSVCCLSYRGGLAAFDQVGVRSSVVTSNPVTAPSLTTANPGTLIAVFVRLNNDTPSSAPAGMTLRASIANSLSMAVYDLSASPAGATGNKTMNFGTTGATNRFGLQLQIR